MPDPASASYKFEQNARQIRVGVTPHGHLHVTRTVSIDYGYRCGGIPRGEI